MSGLYSDMLNELRAELEGDVRQDGEFTSREFYETLDENTRANISLQAIRSRLERRVENGSLEKRKVTVNGKVTTLYSFVENKKAPEGA